MSNPDWMQWLDDPAPPSEEPSAPVVPLRAHHNGPPAPEIAPGAPAAEESDVGLVPASAVLVLGAGGGAGATTTALGIAGSWALASHKSAAVDMTVTGGDLAVRALGNSSGALTAAELADSEHVASQLQTAVTPVSGALVVDRGAAEPAALSLHALDVRLHPHLDTAVYDLGAAGLILPGCAGLLGGTQTAIVLVVQARADSLNRLRSYLDYLADGFGDGALARTVVVISHQNSSEPDVPLTELHQALDGRVRAVHEVPYDRHLATGLSITTWDLRSATVQAYDEIRRSTSITGGDR